jgi:trk system potassium uptake protein TrkH
MSSTARNILAYGIRGGTVLRYGGELCLALVGIALVPAIVAAFQGNAGFAVRAAVAAAVLAAAGVVLSRRREPAQLQPNEALVIVAMGYLLTALLMAWPLAADGLGPLDAVFHSVSAVTTTGLSTIGSMGARSASFLFTQAWMQWYGGFVIVVLAVFLIGPGAAAKELASSEGSETDVLSGTRVRAYQTLIVYSGLTLVGIALLIVLGAGWRDAVLHALSAISTGGFSSHDDSLRGLGGWPVQAGVTLISFAGAVSFVRYLGLVRVARGERAAKGLLWDAELATLAGSSVIVAVLLGLSMALLHRTSAIDALRAAPLLAVSAQTTTGFTPVDVGSLDEASKLVLIVSMFIGGDLGSTAGGVKIFRLLLIVRLVQLALLRPALPPHAVVRPALGQTPLAARDIQNAVGVVALFAVVELVSWLVFVAYGEPALDSLFDVVSATSTVGLSTGVTSPGLDPVLKGVLCLDMWMGRLEVLAVLVLFYPRTWLGRRSEAA